MIKKLAISIILITLLSATLMSPTALGDDAGYPSLLNPPITVTVSVSKTDVKPGETITIDYYITNESKKALFIRKVGFLTIDHVREEKDWQYLDFGGEVVESGKTLKIKSEYTVNPFNFSVYKDKIKCYLRPRIEYCYYTEKVKQGEFPKWYGMFEHTSSPNIVLSTVSSYDFSSMVDISFKAEKRENELIYEFNVTIQNHSDSTIRDFQIYSTIGYFNLEDDNYPETIAPHETVSFHLVYDYNNSNQYSSSRLEGKKYVALYLYVNRFNDDNVIYEISNIQSLNFPSMELQLEAEVTCDVTQAYYNDVIPYTIAIYNPTNNTYKDIELVWEEEFITIGPKETIYVDTTMKFWFSEYDMNIFEGFNESVTLRPDLKLAYNDCTYYYGDWCTNYYDDDFPVVEIEMPEQSTGFLDKVETQNFISYKLYLNNTFDENVEIETIGCVENGVIVNPNPDLLKDGEKDYFWVNLGEYSFSENENGGKSVELLIAAYGEETHSLYWETVSLPISKVEPTPEPTPEPTSEPTPTVEITPVPTSGKLLAELNLIEETEEDELCFELTLTNEYTNKISDLVITNISGEVLETLKTLEPGEDYTEEFTLPVSEKTRLSVSYKLGSSTMSVQTNTIFYMKSDSNEKADDIVPSKTVFQILAAMIFIGLTATFIVLIRKKNKKENFE